MAKHAAGRLINNGVKPVGSSEPSREDEAKHTKNPAHQAAAQMRRDELRRYYAGGNAGPPIAKKSYIGVARASVLKTRRLRPA
jgi:hypothetical protein